MLHVFLTEEFTSTESSTHSQSFKADFAANFGSSSEHDRYAVFRDLFKETAASIQRSTISDPPEKDENEEEKINNTDLVSKEDRYAALREIVEMEFKETNDDTVADVEIENMKNDDDVLLENKTNIFKTTSKDLKEKDEDDIIKYHSPLNIIQNTKKSPLTDTAVKSPCLPVVSEIIEKSMPPTSGSLSDVISGSSPEVDNTGSTSEIGKKNADAAGLI